MNKKLHKLTTLNKYIYENQAQRLNAISVIIGCAWNQNVWWLSQLNPKTSKLVARTFGPMRYFHNLSKWKTIEPTAMSGWNYRLIYSGSFDIYGLYVCVPVSFFGKTSTKKSIPVSCTFKLSSSHLINFKLTNFPSKASKKTF